MLPTVENCEKILKKFNSEKFEISQIVGNTDSKAITKFAILICLSPRACQGSLIFRNA